MSKFNKNIYVPVSIPQAIWDLRDCINSIESSLEKCMRDPSVALRLYGEQLDQATNNLKEALKYNPK